jgi:methylated-DNA-[protein]-cysteine S-methyltransferase
MQVAVNATGVVLEVCLPNRGRGALTSEAFPAAAQAATCDVHAQLTEYFRGERRHFDLETEPHGTPFEMEVWEKLRAIPYGVTTSYGAIAAQLGLVNGARAVGRANGANPIPIIIPCHRVIGGDGQLTGFGGGLPLKCALLELEGALQPAMWTLYPEFNA